MNSHINEFTNNLANNEFAVDFEAEKTPVRLGKSDRYFYMDFNDTNFPVRFKEGRENIGKFFEEKRDELQIEDVSSLTRQKLTSEEIERTIKLSDEIDAFIRKQINFVFGYDVCADVFGEASCVSVTRNGEYYFDSFLNSVLPLVEREYKIRLKASNERIKKYTDMKGMHPAIRK